MYIVKSVHYYEKFPMPGVFFYHVHEKLFKRLITKISLLDGSQNFEVALDLLIDIELSQPIFIAKNNDFFFAGIGNGIILKFDETGKIYKSDHIEIEKS